jgi:hypothetical protein
MWMTFSSTEFRKLQFEESSRKRLADLRVLHLNQETSVVFRTLTFLSSIFFILN